MKILKYPQMFLLYGIVGGLIGGFVGPYLFIIQMNLVQSALNASYSGFPSILYNFAAILGAILGAVTGCAFVHSFGSFRLQIGYCLVCFGLVAAGIMLYLGVDFANIEGRRMALAVDGVGFAWSTALFLWGIYLVREAKSCDHH